MSDGADPTEINALAILGADPDVRELASLERLRLAAKVAQAERNMSEKTRARRWKKDSGAVITHGDLIGELNKAQEIEIDVAPLPVKEQARVMARQGMGLMAIVEALGLLGIDAPSRQTVGKMVRDILAERTAPCVDCGAHVARVQPRLKMVRCDECRSPWCPCGVCGKRAPRSAMSPSIVRRRGGPWTCGSASARRANAKLQPGERSERARKAKARAKPRERREAALKAAETRAAKMTPVRKERQREAGRKANASLTQEQRSDRARNRESNMTQEQRSERTRRANATRKARRAGQAEPSR